MLNSNFTGLYPISNQGTIESTSTFYVKSTNIKVFPSAWRGAKIEKDTQENAVVSKSEPFNVEAALNTEYNITHTAGAIKSYIDEATKTEDTVAGLDLFTFKFFIAGYAFEIYDLDPRRFKNGTELSDELNLYAYIRTGNLELGSKSLDSTRVLVPFYWSTDAPVSLDEKLYDIYGANNFPTGGAIIDESLVNKDSIDDYVFTGLVLSTNPNLLDNKTKSSSHYYGGLPLIKNGNICQTNFWPNIKSGQDEENTAVLIGEEGLIATTPNMLAVGRFNDITNSESINEKTLFAVGNGSTEDYRRNAFEVTGFADINDKAQFKSTIKSGPFKVHYSSELEDAGYNAEISGVYTINDRIELADDGSHIVINRPIDNTIISNSKIGAHIYGNVDVIGSSLYFKDSELAGQSSRTVSTLRVIDVITDSDNNVVGDRGLQITNVHDINNGALSFHSTKHVNGASTLYSLNTNIIMSEDGTELQVGANAANAQLRVGSGAILTNTKLTVDGVEAKEVKTTKLTVDGVIKNLSAEELNVKKLTVSSNINTNTLTVSDKINTSNLTVSSKLVSSSANIIGTLTVGSTDTGAVSITSTGIVPTTDSSLGSSSSAFANAYINTAYINTIDSTSKTITLNKPLAINDSTKCKNIIPLADNTYDLGLSSKKFKTLYAGIVSASSIQNKSDIVIETTSDSSTATTPSITLSSSSPHITINGTIRGGSLDIGEFNSPINAVYAKTITSPTIDSIYARLNELGFKRGNIMYSANTIGYVAQLGTIVYGCIWEGLLLNGEQSFTIDSLISPCPKSTSVGAIPCYPIASSAGNVVRVPCSINGNTITTNTGSSSYTSKSSADFYFWYDTNTDHEYPTETT